MPRPHREIPSQRLAVGRSQASAGPPRPHRSVWWAVGITAAGWALLAYPAVLLALLSLLVMSSAFDTAVTPADVALGIFGLIATLSMAAFPLLLGLAIKVRRRALWVPALLTGALTGAACIYLLVVWVIPLG